MSLKLSGVVRLLIPIGVAGLVMACAGAEEPGESPGAGPDGAAAGKTAATARADTLPSISLSPAFVKLSFTRPVYLTHAGDGSDRLFVLEQPGRIMVFANRSDASEAGVFLDIRSRVLAPPRGHNEEGLLALAFHPKFKDNRRLYVYYSADEPRRGVLSQFEVSSEDPNRADPNSEKVILEVAQPWGNHNGSTALFGPDGFLYVSLGDGGAANDPLNSGQDLSTLLGTVLRIDVDRAEGGKAYAAPKDNPFVGRADARPEIWAYGLRNIWRMSFDRVTGELWGGDVGQNKFEEIDLIVRGGNYGWNLREGMHPFRRGEADAPLIDPVVEYGRSEGISVTGGYVYRGKQFPGLVGAYLYADYVSGRVWALRHEGGRLAAHREVYHNPRMYISSFGEDEAGELYVCCFGRLFRIVVR
jgi:glucose/arabinose dehydrogenase